MTDIREKLDELEAADKAMHPAPWFAEEVTEDGLTIVDDGLTADDKLFPFACETFEAHGIVLVRNSLPALLRLVRALLEERDALYETLYDQNKWIGGHPAVDAAIREFCGEEKP